MDVKPKKPAIYCDQPMAVTAGGFGEYTTVAQSFFFFNFNDFLYLCLVCPGHSTRDGEMQLCWCGTGRLLDIPTGSVWVDLYTYTTTFTSILLNDKAFKIQMAQVKFTVDLCSQPRFIQWTCPYRKITAAFAWEMGNKQCLLVSHEPWPRLVLL